MRPTIFAIPFLAQGIISSGFVPFLSPFDSSAAITDNSTSSGHNYILDLFLQKRSNCPTNYDSCSSFAAADKSACCTSGSFCTTDKAHNIACCPTGASCTGSLTAASTTTGVIVGGGSTTATTTNAFLTATFTTASTTATRTASTVLNSYFPFPYIPTSYANAAACTSAYSVCSSNYAICTADLQGGSFGVTVDSPNGGVTVAAATGTYSLPAISAASICSSLSAEGCWGLQTTNCAQFGTASETSTTTSATASFIVGNGVARQTPLAGVVGVGIGLGVLGQFI